jgi:hypothetical protein
MAGQRTKGDDYFVIENRKIELEEQLLDLQEKRLDLEQRRIELELRKIKLLSKRNKKLKRQTVRELSDELEPFDAIDEFVQRVDQRRGGSPNEDSDDEDDDADRPNTDDDEDDKIVKHGQTETIVPLGAPLKAGRKENRRRHSSGSENDTPDLLRSRNVITGKGRRCKRRGSEPAGGCDPNQFSDQYVVARRQSLQTSQKFHSMSQLSSSGSVSLQSHLAPRRSNSSREIGTNQEEKSLSSQKTAKVSNQSPKDSPTDPTATRHVVSDAAIPSVPIMPTGDMAMPWN